MAAINAFYVVPGNGEARKEFKVFRKLKTLAKKISIQTSPKQYKNFGFSLLKDDGSTISHPDTLEDNTKPLSKIWDEDLKDLEFDETLRIFLSKTSENLHNEPFVYKSIYSIVLGDTAYFEPKENPSKVISEEGFLTGISKLREESPSASADFNIISFDADKPNRIEVYRGLRPLNVIYSLAWGCFIFSSNHSNKPILAKEDLLSRQPFLPLDLDPYSAYLITEDKIHHADQNLEYGEDLCCGELKSAVKAKKLLLDFDNKKVYHPNDLLYYSYCPFCGLDIRDLIE